MGACECMAAGDRCAARTEACWCPSECNPEIACICGGGRFLACEDKSVVAVLHDVAGGRAGEVRQPAFVQYVGDLCTSAGTPTCVAPAWRT